MKIKILDKYIFTELINPLFLGAAVFTLLFMSVDIFFRIASMVVQKQLSMGDGLACIYYNLPYILVFTFPMSVLLSMLVGFGRLSGDSEIIAMKSGGISFYRIAVPAVFLAGIITIASFYMNEQLSPEFTYRAKNIIAKTLTKEGAKIWENITLKTTTSDGLERIITAIRFNYKKGLMEGVMIQDSKGTKPIRWIRADLAVWETNQWYLVNADVYNLDPDKPGDIKYQTHFKKYTSPIPYTPMDIETRERSPEEMSSINVQEKINSLMIDYKKNNSQDKELFRQINSLKVMLHQKIALPFTCLVFALIGIPLGIRPHRTSTSIGLGLSIVFIFIYYILMSIGRALGENSLLPPVIASWMPNIIFASVGLFLLYKKGQN